MLAAASEGIVIGYGVGPDPAARIMAQNQKVDVRHYDVIYDLRDDVERALRGLLEPVYEEAVVGHAEVRAVFTVSRRRKVAGVHVTDGAVTRDSMARVVRYGDMVHEGEVISLRRFTEDVQEVTEGYECGVQLDDFDDFAEGDTIEFYRLELVRGY
jgi:translation initiation factor IF-2